MSAGKRFAPDCSGLAGALEVLLGSWKTISEIEGFSFSSTEDGLKTVLVRKAQRLCDPGVDTTESDFFGVIASVMSLNKKIKNHARLFMSTPAYWGNYVESFRSWVPEEIETIDTLIEQAALLLQMRDGFAPVEDMVKVYHPLLHLVQNTQPLVKSAKDRADDEEKRKRVRARLLKGNGDVLKVLSELSAA